MATRDGWMGLRGLWRRPLARVRRPQRRDRRVRPTISGPGWGSGEVLEPRLALSSGAEVHVLARRAPGRTIQTAMGAGSIGAGQSVNLSNSVGKQAPNVYYEFSIGSREVLQATLAGLKGQVGLALLNANGQAIVATGNGGAHVESVQATLSPGTYVIQVSHSGKGKTHFGLSLAASAAPASTSTPPPNATDNHPNTGTGGGTTATGGGTTTTGGGTTTTGGGTTTTGGGTTTTGGGTTTTGNPPAPTSSIPAEGVYSIAVTGTTYYGSTNFLSSATQFSPYLNFSLKGNMVLSPTIDKTNASHNGINPHDVLFTTGNIGVGGAGVFEYATNTLLYELVGGNSSQGAALDMANVTEDDKIGMITVKPDPAEARVSQLAVMYVSNGLLSTPYSIIVGEIDIHFSHGGSQVNGTITLYGEGMIEAGTVAITATFQGTLQG